MKQCTRILQDVEHKYREGKLYSMDKLSFLLHECTKTNDVFSGRILHSLLLSSGLKSESLLQNFLIRLFASSGSMLEASLVFVEVIQPSIYTWHAIISGHFIHGFNERALELFYTMQEQHVNPGRCTFLCILKVCGSSEALVQGQAVHDQIVACGLEAEIVVGSSLIDMYAKCRSIDEAYQVFEKLNCKDLICWSTMIGAFSQNDQSLAALELFERMEEEGFKPDRAVFLCVLKACGNLGIIRQGRLVHAQVIKDTLESDSLLGSCLIDMYAKCANVEDAQRVFDLLEHPDVITWNALMEGYSQQGSWPHSLKLLDRMQASGTKPDDVLLGSILRACSSTGSIKNVILVHDTLVRTGLESNMFIQGMLISMYVNCGALEDAQQLFDTLEDKHQTSWNAIMAGYIQHEKAYQVLELHEKMILENIQPDISIFVNVLKACSKLQNLLQGKLIHLKIFLWNFQVDLAIGNALIDMYVKCRCLNMACQVFEGLPKRNSVTWNSIISGYAYNKQELMAIELFQKMQEEGISPDEVTYACMMRPCGSMKALGLAQVIHKQIVAFGFETDSFVGSVIVDTYSECGSWEEAHEVFEKLPNKSVVCWNTIIGQNVQLGNSVQALRLFEQMQEAHIDADKITYLCLLKICSMLVDGMWQQVMIIHNLILKGELESDVFLGSCLVDSYSKNGDLEAARNVFDNMRDRNVVTWGSMIAGYVQHGQGLAALELISQMQSEGIRPERSTILVAMKACVCTGAVKQGRLIHDWIIRDDFELDLEISSAIVNFYTKCGSLQEAIKVFKSLPHQDLVCFHALITGYAHHGDSELAEQCFVELKQKSLKPVDLTYAGVLSAYSHVGQVDGAQYFQDMNIDQQTLQQYTCMIDLFGRAGRLEEAVEVMQTMPDLPDVAVWLVFLTACKMYGNFRLGRECFDQLCRLNLNVAAGYMLMSDICADSDMP